MSSPPSNRALWQDAVRVPGVVRTAPLPTPDAHKILIRVQAWAINPCDYMLQDRDMVNYPLILGCDVAGTVEAVAPDSPAAAHFRIGDRVFGFAPINGFQEHIALEYKLVARIPGEMSFREAVVLGLCSATSALFLFGADYLNLEYPRLGAARNGKTVLVWGGSSAVGSNAIQLVAAAGYDVVTTCSERNFEYVKGLGAVRAFDYKDPEVSEKVAAELDKGECAGIFMAAGLDGGNAAAYKVAAASKQKLNLSSSNVITNLADVPQGVTIRQPTPENFKPFPDCWFETTGATFGGYMAEALAKGVYKIAPPPLVVNTKGLEGIQEAVDLMRVVGEKGVKAAVGHLKGLKEGEELSVVKLVVEKTLE